MNARAALHVLALLATSGIGCLAKQSMSLDDSGFASDSGPDGGMSCATATGLVTVSPQSLDFGAVVVKTVTSRIVTVANCTLADVTITPSVIGAQASLFTAAGTTAGAEPFALRAGESATLTVSYAPLTASALDSAGLQLLFSSGGFAVVALQGIALGSGLKITPNPLNFSFVQPGDMVTLPLHLTNVGNEKITVTSTTIVVSGTPTAYSIASGSWMGGDLQPGDSEDVNVLFSPSVKAQYTGELDISSTDNTNIVPVTLQGYGGGAIISCLPLALDFETVAANIGTTLPVICTNSGSDVPNHPEAGVILSTLLTDKAVYSAQVDPSSVNQASAAAPLAAGQAVELDVIYTPTASAMEDTGILTINSNVTDGTSLAPPRVALTGIAVDEPSCTYAITPTAIQFGEVPQGTTETGGFTITNLGPNECLVTGLDLGAATQSAFWLPNGPVISQRLSAPNVAGPYPTFLQVNVAFLPEAAVSYSGSVQFTISDAAAPHQAVNLSGTGGFGCFIVLPDQLEFGTVGTSNGRFCSSETRQLVGVNSCAQSVTIQSATLTGSSAYVLTSGQTPQTIAPGASSTPFVVGFEPSGAGASDAILLLQTDLLSAPFGVGVSGSAIDGGTLTDEFMGPIKKVDILWIMDIEDDDDSASERDTVAKQAPTFVSALNQLNLDFQIGVTSTDWCANGITGTSENGRILPCPGCKIDGQQPTVITASDVNAGPDLQYLLEIGANSNVVISNTCTPDDQYFEVGYQAVVAMTDQAWNAPLIRPDAYLAIVTVNGGNADDYGSEPPQWFAAQFLSVKGADHPELFSWSYINPSGLGTPGGHQPFGGLPGRIAYMLGVVGGVALDSTQTNWTQGMTDLWNIAIASSYRHPLSGTPDPTTILVYLDGPPPGQTMPGQSAGVQLTATDVGGAVNWTYDATSNTVDINNENVPLSSSDTIYVEYTLACP
jgi:hypothetical protein